MNRFFALSLAGLFAAIIPPALWAEHPDGSPQVEGFMADTGDGYVQHVFASVVSELPLSIANGEVLEIVTANPPEAGDPALHLLRADTREQVAFDDSSDGANGARLTYSASSGDFILVVRARTADSGGVTRLFRGSVLWRDAVVFGGAQITYANLQAGETLQSVALPGGPPNRHRLYLLDTGNGHIIPTPSRSGVGGAVILDLETDQGARTLLVGVRPAVAPGYVRIVRNDAALPGSDRDRDGLGSSLEADIGTCETTTQSVSTAGGDRFDCRRAADPRDTDGDGLRDDWETLGLMRFYERAPQVRVHEALRLPAWGASPRHKDVFIEVDFMQRSAGETVLPMSATRARAFAMNYNDTLTNPDPAAIRRRASTLANPDGLHGIRAHLDIGRNAIGAADAVMFGNWGGFSATAPVTDASGGVAGADYNTVWHQSLSPNRRGVFRYLPGYDGGGGQTAINNYAATGPINSVSVLAHEFGHAMGMGHSGPPRQRCGGSELYGELSEHHELRLYQCWRGLL